MTLFECFEARKSALEARLYENKKPSAALICIRDTFDTILYQYMNECKNDNLRSHAAFMVNTAKVTLPLIECVSDTKIWISKNAEDNKGKKNVSFGFSLFLIIALLTLGVMVAYQLPHFSEVPSDNLWIAAGLIGFSFLMIFLSGVYLTKKPKYKDTNEYKADIFINPDDILRRLTAIILQIDKSLESIAAEEKDAPLVGDEKMFDTKTLDFYASLLEGKYSGNGEFALEQLNEVSHVLHEQGVTLVDYEEASQNYFELLPSAEGEKTLVPAMLYDGRLIRKGLATKGEQVREDD